MPNIRPSKTIAQPDTASYLGGLSSQLVDMPMQANMSIELHPNICPPELGLGALGDVFLVTAGGGERLTAFPREIHAVSRREQALPLPSSGHSSMTSSTTPTTRRTQAP